MTKDEIDAIRTRNNELLLLLSAAREEIAKACDRLQCSVCNRGPTDPICHCRTHTMSVVIDRINIALKDRDAQTEKESIAKYRRDILMRQEMLDALREGLSEEAAAVRASERADATMKRYWP